MIIASDNLLGDVICDEHDLVVARPKWRGKEVCVHLMIEKNSCPERCLSVAREIVARLDEHVMTGCAAAAGALVELANEWREDQATPEFDPATLTKLFEFDGVLVFECGRTEFIYTDGDVFSGCAVIVDRAPDGTFGNARFEL